MIMVEISLERKITIYFPVWEDVGVLQGEFKIKTKGQKLHKAL